jgi:predicted nucleic acid-binding protein
VIADAPHLTVCDAGPIIHLDELRSLDLLEGLGSVLIPSKVWQEISHHCPTLVLREIPDARLVNDEEPCDPELLAFCRSMDLDAGERSALAILQKHHGGLFLTDDAAARLVAERLGYTARGSIGIIVRSIRRKTRTLAEMRGLLESIPRVSTLHLQRSLLEKVIAQLPVE